jgi:4-amino-4-deoxy-L-arabinose transferase-like glycosyltransferase
MPNYVQLEFQITTFIIACLYKLFGYHYELARIVPVSFFMGSAIFLYLTAKTYYSAPVARFTVLLYGLFPLNILYSRTIMPEAAALFFCTGAFYLFSEWLTRQRLPWLCAAAMFTGLAILEKVPAVFICIPMIVMATVVFKKNIFRRWELIMFLVISLVPPFVYFLWMQSIAESTFVTGIATKHIFPRMFSDIFTKEALWFFRREMPQAFTWCGLFLFAGGFLSAKWKKEYPILVWALAMILELVMIVAVIQFNYYLIFFGPPAALLAASMLHKVYTTEHGRLISGLIIVLMALNAYLNIRPVYGPQNMDLLQQARMTEKLTKKGDLIIVGTDDPSLLNASNRKGWRVTNTIPGDPVAELQYFIANGAKYFVPLKGYIDGDPQGKLRAYLDANYRKIEIEGGYSIYSLSKSQD